MARATFYEHFSAEDDLSTAYLDEVDHTWTGQLQGRPRPCWGALPSPLDAAPVR